MSDKEIEQTKEAEGQSAAGGLAAEAIGQLSEFVKQSKPSSGSDAVGVIANSIERSALSSVFAVSDKERTEAVTNMGKSLDAMVKGDLPYLKERMKELGVSTKELEELEKKMTEKVEAARPLQDAIIKGDSKALQKLVATMDPKQLAETAELIQKHFDKSGVGLEVDYVDGKLVVGRSNGDRAVAISKDNLDVIGVNKDGSYDFSKHFRHENAGKELQGLADGAVSRYLNPPWNNYREIKPYYGNVLDNIPNIEINSYKKTAK